MSIETRSVKLYCPVCGNDQFSSMDLQVDSLIDAPDETRIQCADCKNTFTKAELIESNREVIDANIDEMKQKLLKDLDRKLKKIFK